ncbi:MAG TPA: SDR family oxidoreductase [Candidatus Limnocylindria bacterium]|jgi:NAD(P)-dependent dehydrogenase (short-subunit alcohol dehydrogenase family)|nr:SDR family oxidoreductase [Candidatus Limnocylindria bacterium]
MRTVNELRDLTGRVALITGGAGHLGRAIGDALAESGASIAVLDVSADACVGEAKRLTQTHGVRAMALPLDLDKADSVRSVPEAVRRELGRLDILVNNAALVGTSPLKGWTVPFAEQSVDTFRRALEVNLTAAFALTQVCAPLLAVSGQGSVVNVLSIYALVGPDRRIYEGTALDNPAGYAASKGGMLQLTRWLATTLAPAIRVNAITPGGIFRDTKEPFLSRYVERTPLRRMATEEDFKGAFAFLASGMSQYVTGQNLIVDGGWTAW